MWIINDEMVGDRVAIQTEPGEWEDATVIAVSDHTANIKVKADDGDILIGNQWEPLT